jgi:hypothetical protein
MSYGRSSAVSLERAAEVCVVLRRDHHEDKLTLVGHPVGPSEAGSYWRAAGPSP